MKYKKLLILALSMLFLASCRGIPLEDTDAVNMSGAGQSARSHLYARVPGLSEMRLQTLRADRFSLRFSHTGHFYTETIYVEITSALEDAVIYFTTDGSDPVKGLTSRHNQRYTEPVRIEAGYFNVATILRARAFQCEDVYSNILTHTYFVSADIHSRFEGDLYIFSITSDPYNLFDHDNGILVHGRLHEEFVRANPGVQVQPNAPANFNVRGRESERPAYVQVITPGGELVISQSIGIRVRGGWSRQSRQQNLGLYARSEYDPIFDRFYYNFFRFFEDHGITTVRGTDIPVESYTQIVLRNGASDRGSAHIREELGQVLARQAGIATYKGIAPAAMFLNGVYRGFFWLQQMHPEYYFFDHFGEVPRDNIEILLWYQEPDSSNVYSDEAAFQAYSQIMCLYDYMRYFAFQTFVANHDWPRNNAKIWRFNGEGGELVNRYYDGMFRWVLYDVEMGWGIRNRGFRERSVQRATTQSTSFGNLMRRPDMVEKFCNQMFDLINTVFMPGNVNAALDRLIALQDREFRFAISRGIAETIDSVVDHERAVIRDFARNRAQYVIRDMHLTFGVPNEIYNVRVTGKDGASVRLNTLTLDGAGTIRSGYFTAHSVMLSADSPNFDHWLINGERYDAPEIMLNSGKARNGNIFAEVVLNN